PVLQLHQKPRIDRAHLEDASTHCAASDARARVLGKKPAAAHQNLSRLRCKHRKFVVRIARAHDEPVEPGQPAQLDAAGPIVIGPRAELANRLTRLNYFSSVSQVSTTIAEDAIITARSR